jgi:hypothetical protein
MAAADRPPEAASVAPDAALAPATWTPGGRQRGCDGPCGWGGTCAGEVGKNGLCPAGHDDLDRAFSAGLIIEPFPASPR